jgi:hypothetical protein
MKYILVLSFLVSLSFATDDVELYNKLKMEISKKDSVVHKDGDLKVVIKDKDINLTKKIKKLLEKENIVKETKKYEKILKD